MYDNFEKLVKTRQSCRDFSDKPVEKEKLDKLMDLARLTPSACNSQPWTMHCVHTKEAVDAVRECLQFQGHNPFLSGAKAFIALSEKQATLKSFVSGRFDRNRFVKYDIGELVAYLTLGAKALGLETCIIGWMDEEKLASVLELSDEQVCTIVIAIGYSEIPVREKVRKSSDEVIKYL